MWTVAVVCVVVAVELGIVLGWWLRGSVDALPRPVFDLPAATARQIRKAQRRQRADLREALRRTNY